MWNLPGHSSFFPLGWYCATSRESSTASLGLSQDACRRRRCVAGPVQAHRCGVRAAELLVHPRGRQCGTTAHPIIGTANSDCQPRRRRVLPPRSLTHLHPRSDPCLVYLTQDIGWADFGYHSGSTANTPHVTEWTKQPGTMVMHDFHSGGTHCTPTRASILTGRTPFRDCVFGTKGADGDDMTEMIDNFTFAPKRTWTIGNAVRQASPDYFSQHFGKVRSTDACLFRSL